MTEKGTASVTSRVARIVASRSSCGRIDSSVCGMLIQPSHRVAALRRAAADSPPDRMGSRSWTGLGSKATSGKVKKRPVCATTGSDHSRLVTSMASSSRGPRVAKSSPAATHSPGYHPAPTPQIARPSETMSSVAKARAETNGCRRA
ncbi:hypothetical protein GCM10022226_33870 [Sphaerisporangium flaviroseum]|uniref:Uncharacterized protein n=1 Tax=Sphaerisporangium flaviroseum TaxID=509199 RepID=A0ABP7I5R3_9ACTN